MKQNSKKTKREIHRRNLDPRTMSFHCRPCSNYCLTFHQQIASALYDDGFRYVYADYDDGYVKLHFTREEVSGYPCTKLNWIRSKKDKSIKNATATKAWVVNYIASYLNIDEGDFYFRTSQLIKNTKGYVLLIESIIEGYPLNSNNTFVPPTLPELVEERGNEPTMSQYTDQQLWDELKSRGYIGTISKQFTLE